MGGVATSYTYNLANWITAMSNVSGGQTHSSYTYSYALDGKQTAKTDLVNMETVQYTYDNHGRLLSEKYSKGVAITGAVSYTYDKSGNRATMTDTRDGSSVTAYSYDANNRMTAAEKQHTDGTNDLDFYIYDKNGNQISKRSEMLSPADENVKAISL